MRPMRPAAPAVLAPSSGRSPNERPPLKDYPEPPDLPLPRLDLTRVFRARERIFDLLATGSLHPGDALEHAALEELVANLKEALGDRGIPDEALRRTCDPLAGRALTAALKKEFAWRVAGNLPRLKAGLPAYPWSAQRDWEWAPLEVTAAALRAVPRKAGPPKAGCEYTLRALAGTYCPGTIRKWWSLDQARFVAGEIGFSAPWGRLPYAHAYQLVGLRFLALLDPNRSGDRPAFQRVAPAASLLAHNRRVLQVRCRAEPCPRGYLHPCHRCAAGYGKRNESPCPHAVHALEYVAKSCGGCGRDGAPFDPEWPGDLCVECATKGRMKPEG